MRMICPSNNKILISYYDSLSSMSNIQVPSINMKLYRKSCLKSGMNEEDKQNWYGCSGVTEVKRIVELRGWPEGVNKGRELMDTIKLPKLPSIRRKLRWGTTGHTLNLSRLYSGQADSAWLGTHKNLTSKRAKRGRTYINLIIDISVNCNVDSEKYFWRGALGCILAKTLQDAGYSVRILVCFSVGDSVLNCKEPGSLNHTIILNVKDYGDIIEYNKFFAITALAGAARYYFFKAILSLDTKIDDGLGSADPINRDTLDYFLDKNTLLIVENIWSKKAALKKAKNLIESI